MTKFLQFFTIRTFFDQKHNIFFLNLIYVFFLKQLLRTFRLFKDKIPKFFPFGGTILASLDPNPLTQLNPGPIRPIRIQSNNRNWRNLRTYGYREVLKWGSRVTSVTQQIVSHLGNRFSFCSFRWKPFPADKKRFSHHLASASFFFLRSDGLE